MAGAAGIDDEEGVVPVVEEHIDIERSRDEVWAYVSDPANVVVFSSNLSEYEQASPGPRGKGTRDRGRVKVAGRTLAFEHEIDAWEPGQHLGLRSTEAPMGMSWHIDYRLEDLGDGVTRLTQRTESTLGSFFGKLADNLVANMYARDTRANLANLKSLLEET